MTNHEYDIRTKSREYQAKLEDQYGVKMSEQDGLLPHPDYCYFKVTISKACFIFTMNICHGWNYTIQSIQALRGLLQIYLAGLWR